MRSRFTGGVSDALDRIETVVGVPYDGGKKSHCHFGVVADSFLQRTRS